MRDILYISYTIAVQEFKLKGKKRQEENIGIFLAEKLNKNGQMDIAHCYLSSFDKEKICLWSENIAELREKTKIFLSKRRKSDSKGRRPKTESGSPVWQVL